MGTFMEQVAYSREWIDSELTLDAPQRSDVPRTDQACTHLVHTDPAFPHQADGLSGKYQLRGESQRGRRAALLTSIVMSEILPRLARIRQNAAMTTRAAVPRVTPEDDTVELVRLLLAPEAAGAIAFIERLRLGGATPASLYLGIVTQAAHSLGELWDEDRCDFTQVTIGMGRLQQVVRALSPHFQMQSVSRAQADSILLAPAPDDHHTLGLLMLSEFFRREGWHVAGGPATSTKDAVAIVRGSWIDVAGFSIGSLARLDRLANCITAVRRASANRDLFVMVGGPLLLSHPDLVTRVGADSSATDAESAIRQARGLLAMRSAAD